MEVPVRRILLASAVAAALASPLAAQTSTTVSTGTSPNYFGPLGIDSQGGAASAIAQTFMLPLNQNYLQSFTFYLTNAFNGNSLFLQAAVYAFNTDQLTGPALFTSALFAGSGNNSGNDALTIGGGNTPLNLLLAPNTMYALVLWTLQGNGSTPDGSGVLVNLAPGDPIANGALFYATSTNQADLSSPGGFTAYDGTTDVAFDASFTQSAVPEPATLMLVATGVAGLGGVGLRRRRKNAPAA
jgi:hypothetical protein